MRELLNSNDPVLLGYVEALLADQGIASFIFDRHISLMEGSIGAFPRRLVVESDYWLRASHILTDAGLGAWVKRDEPA
jgi:hypothetical protein